MNYDAYIAAISAGAAADTYLKRSDGTCYFYPSEPPAPNTLPSGITYKQGHAAWAEGSPGGGGGDTPPSPIPEEIS